MITIKKPRQRNAEPGLTCGLTIWTYRRGEACPGVSRILADDGARVMAHEDGEAHAESGLELYTCRLRFDLPRGAAQHSLARIHEGLEELQGQLGCDVELEED